MAEDRRQQDELFAQYWDALADDPTAPPPASLDPTLAYHAHQMQPPDPSAVFVSRLEQQLRALPAANVPPDSEAAPLLRSGLPVRPVRRPSRRIAPIFSVAAALLVLLLGAALLAGMLAGRSRQITSGTGPPSGDTQSLTDASDILQRAKAALNPSAVKSYVVTETLISPQLQTVKTWYQAPNLWRVETITTTAKPNTDKTYLQVTTEVSDGSNLWEYDAGTKVINVKSLQSMQTVSAPAHPIEGLVSESGQEIDTALQCYTPSLQGSELVAGRPAYVVVLKGWHCYGTTMVRPSDIAIWIDQQTFFVLGRASNYGNGPTHPSDQMISIQYNVAIDPSTFTFTPPIDATLQDYRPQPAPSATEFQNEISALAKQASYPVFLPQYLPGGLVPLHLPPNAANAAALVFDYGPSTTASTPSADTPGIDPAGGIRVTQSQPSYQSFVSVTADTTFKPTQVGGEPAWVRSIPPSSSQMLVVDSAVTFFHQGTMVSVGSRSYSTAELLKVAASLAAVPGGHTPLPNPTLTSLLRQEAGFAVLLPTNLPSGLVAQPPQLGARIEIRYHNSDGELGLLLTEASITAQAANPVGDPYTSSGLPLTLANGLTAHFETADCNHGQASLYWQQDGANIILISVPTRRQSSGFSKEEMIRVANSLSKTADLGSIEPAPTNPPPSLPFPEATASTCPTPPMPAAVPTP